MIRTFHHGRDMGRGSIDDTIFYFDFDTIELISIDFDLISKS